MLDFISEVNLCKPAFDAAWVNAHFLDDCFKCPFRNEGEPIREFPSDLSKKTRTECETDDRQPKLFAHKNPHASKGREYIGLISDCLYPILGSHVRGNSGGQVHRPTWTRLFNAFRADPDEFEHDTRARIGWVRQFQTINEALIDLSLSRPI
jgi:hypothetical protein